MKYAIISDVHGNLPALLATINDAESHGVEKYLLLGDYSTSFPWGNSVIDVIRGLKNAVVIQGNGEGYLADLKKNPPTDFSCEQFKPVYWAYHSLTDENLNYLIRLPISKTLSDDKTNIYLNHSMDVFYRSPQVYPFHSRNFRKMMTHKPFTHDEYIMLARDALLDRPDALSDINKLPKGIHLFGHNHIQFYMEVDGRLFINPGSCGEPLDWDTTASYTILDVSEEGWVIIERRVQYNLNMTAEKLDNSEFTDYAPMWSKVMKLELLTGKDYFMSFVIHLIETGRTLGQSEYPVNNNVWDFAVNTWDEDKI